MIEYVLDAHALVWHLEGNPKLGSQAAVVLNDPNSFLLLPSIALAEACYVINKGRTAIADYRAVIRAVRADPRVTVVPLDLEIVELAIGLGAGLEMHDAQIVATAIRWAKAGKSVRLLTIDASIVRSGLVQILW